MCHRESCLSSFALEPLCFDLPPSKLKLMLSGAKLGSVHSFKAEPLTPASRLAVSTTGFASSMLAQGQGGGWCTQLANWLNKPRKNMLISATGLSLLALRLGHNDTACLQPWANAAFRRRR